MRWIVGDVQGCARELDQLLRTIAFDPSRDELWSAGDLVNRGPDSLAALRLWRSVGGRGVIGNHEVYALNAAAGRWPRKRDTLQAVFDAPDAADLLQSLRTLQMLVFLPGERPTNDAWLVHGGIHPKWHDLQAMADRMAGLPHDDAWLDSRELKFATSVRCCTADGERSSHDGGPKSCPSPFRPWDEHYRGPTLVVHGHWARRGYYRGTRSLGLDSGCVYGGPLTAWCQDEDRIVQVASQGPYW